MASGEYLNFDVSIERRGDVYRARVYNSPFGDATTDFAQPLTDTDFRGFAGGRTRSRKKREDPPIASSPKDVGMRLFAAAFGGRVGETLTRTLDEANRNGFAGARIRIDLREAGELASAPWELLYDPERRRFLALSGDTPIVRYLQLSERIPTLAVEGRLRILVLIADPKAAGYDELEVEREWQRLQDVLKPLLDRGAVELDRVRPPTLRALQDALVEHGHHVFHFIGHGAFDSAASDGLLVFETDDGGPHEVSAEQLGILLHNERTLRLAVLNACEAGRGSATDPYVGMAQTLIRMGIPAVVGMQFAVSDGAAIELAERFYRSIAVGVPVDAALTEARVSIFQQGDAFEWATPVLYMRSPDGHIFAVPKVDAEPPPRLVTPGTPVVPPTRKDWAARHPVLRALAVGIGALLLVAGLAYANGDPFAEDVSSAPSTAATTSPTVSPAGSVVLPPLAEYRELSALQRTAAAAQLREHITDGRTLRLANYSAAIRIASAGARDPGPGNELAIGSGEVIRLEFAPGIHAVGVSYQEGLYNATFEVELSGGKKLTFQGRNFFPAIEFFGVYAQEPIVALVIRNERGSFSLRSFYFYAVRAYPPVFR